MSGGLAKRCPRHVRKERQLFPVGEFFEWQGPADYVKLFRQRPRRPCPRPQTRPKPHDSKQLPCDLSPGPALGSRSQVAGKSDARRA
jgi:hypothetical protein